MGRRLLIAGFVNSTQKKAIKQAATYKGKEPAIEQYHDCVIKHKVGGKTIIVPISAFAYVGVSIPNYSPTRVLKIEQLSLTSADDPSAQTPVPPIIYITPTTTSTSTGLSCAAPAYGGSGMDSEVAYGQTCSGSTTYTVTIGTTVTTHVDTYVQTGTAWSGGYYADEGYLFPGWLNYTETWAGYYNQTASFQWDRTPNYITSEVTYSPFPEIAAHNEAKAAAANSYYTIRFNVITISSGLVLSKTQEKTYPFRSPVYYENYIGSTYWNGGGKVDVFSGYSPSWNNTGAISFSVPDDVFGPASKTLPHPNGATVTSAELKRWNDSNAAEYKKYEDRLKIFHTAASDVGIGAMAVGDIDPRTASALKCALEGSDRVGRLQGIEVVCISSTTQDTSEGLSIPGTLTITERYEFRYQKENILPDGTVELEIKSFESTGFVRKVLTQHKDTNGNNSLVSILEEYDSWYAGPGGGSAPHFIPSAEIIDDICYFFSGVIQNGYYPDTKFSSSPSYSDEYRRLTPVYPQYTNTVQCSSPAFFHEYRADNVPKYTEPPAIFDVEWLKTTIPNSTTISIIPFGQAAMVDNILTPLGMFTYPHSESVTMLEIYGTASFRYRYEDNTLEFIGWKPLNYADDRDENANTELGFRILRGIDGRNIQIPDEEGNLQDLRSRLIGIPAGVTLSSYNSIVRYGDLQWPDVIDRAKEEAKIRASGGGDQLMHEIIRAVNTTLKKAR